MESLLDIPEEKFFESAIDKRFKFRKMIEKIEALAEYKISELDKMLNTPTTVCWNGGGRSWNILTTQCVPKLFEFTKMEIASTLSGNYDVFMISNSEDDLLSYMSAVKRVLIAFAKTLNEDKVIGKHYTFSISYPKDIIIKDKISDYTTEARKKHLNPQNMCALFPCVNIAMSVKSKKIMRGYVADPEYPIIEEEKYVIYVECAYVSHMDINTFRTTLLTNKCMGKDLPYHIPNEIGTLLFSEQILSDRSGEKGMDVDLQRKLLYEKLANVSYIKTTKMAEMYDQLLLSFADKQFDTVSSLTGLLLRDASEYVNSNYLQLVILLTNMNYIKQLGIDDPGFNTRANVLIPSISPIEFSYLVSISNNIGKLTEAFASALNSQKTIGMTGLIVKAIQSYTLIFSASQCGGKTCYDKNVVFNLAKKLVPSHILDVFSESLMQILRSTINSIIAQINLELKEVYPESFIMIVGGDAMRRYNPDMTTTNDIDTKLYYTKGGKADMLKLVTSTLSRFVVYLFKIRKEVLSSIESVNTIIPIAYVDNGMLRKASLKLFIDPLFDGNQQFRLRLIKRNADFPIDLFSIDYRTKFNIALVLEDGTNIDCSDFYNLSILDVPLIETVVLPDRKMYIHDVDAVVPVASLSFLIHDIETTYTDKRLASARLLGRKREKDKTRLDELKRLISYRFEYDPHGLNTVVTKDEWDRYYDYGNELGLNREQKLYCNLFFYQGTIYPLKIKLPFSTEILNGLIKEYMEKGAKEFISDDELQTAVIRSG